MSNEIYPLGGHEHPVYGHGRRLSVNERLTPIFAALADDPEGWEWEYKVGAFNYGIVFKLPTSHEDCDRFRLVPKRKTIPVEIPYNIGLAGHCECPNGQPGVILPVPNIAVGNQLIEAIRLAMEGK